MSPSRPSPRVLVAAVTAAAVLTVAVALSLGDDRPSVGSQDAPRTLVAAADRERAPALSGLTLDGQPLDLATLRGTVLVLNIWGSWCGPCKKEQPDLVRAADELRDEGVELVGINVRDSRSAAQAHVRRYGVPYPSFFDEGFRLVARFRDVPPQAVPSTILLDRRGRVAALLFGSTNYDELTTLARRLAAEPT